MAILRRILRGRELRMVWQVTKEGRSSFLVGTAHFCLYSFGRSLKRLLSSCDIALFEGPLDPASMEKVVATGMQGQDADGLFDQIHEETLGTIARVLDLTSEVPVSDPKSRLASAVSKMKPWLAFFSIYTAFLKKNGWKYSVDMEAYTIGKKLGKNVVFMETIDEQIDVLESLSLQQMSDFLNRINSWHTYTGDFMQWYLNGDLGSIARNPYSFPTRNPWVIDRRDEIFFLKMQPYLERCRAAVFVGAPHVAGVNRLLVDAGYVVEQVFGT
jgi:uncharacterized protein YbaP (TraB family)